MQISVEISSYPLADDYIPAIKTFIDMMNQVPGLTVVTNTMSTQIFGELELVMNALRQKYFCVQIYWYQSGSGVKAAWLISGLRLEA